MSQATEFQKAESHRSSEFAPSLVTLIFVAERCIVVPHTRAIMGACRMTCRLGLRTSTRLRQGLKSWLLSLAVAFGTLPFHATSWAEDGLAIRHLLVAVHAALAEAQNDLKAASLPPLASVELELKTVLVKEGAANFGVIVVSAESKVSSEATNTMKLRLTPPKPGRQVEVGALQVITELFKQALIGSARTANVAKQLEGTGSVPLVLNQVSSEVAFIITERVTGGAGLFDLIPINIGFTASVQESKLQKATFIFGG